MIFDIIVIAILLISALHAFWRGFIREVLTIFAAIGGLFAAITFGNVVRPFMDGWLGIEAGKDVEKLFDLVPMTLVSGVLAYALVFIIVFGILSIISHLIAESARALGLGAVDRTLGVVFGLVRGLLILGIFYLPVHIVMDQETKDEWFKEARTHIYVEAVSKWLESVLPADILPVTRDEEDATAKKDESEAREQLEKMDVLKPSDDAAPEKPEAVPAQKEETGYGATTRKVLDTLIEKGIEAGTAAPGGQ